MKQEEHTSETERLLHLILANIDDLVAVVDLNGKRLYNSPSYEGIFGSRAGLRGSDSFGEIHPDDKQKVRQVFDETVRTGVGQRIVYRFAMPDGRIRFIESHGNVVRDAQGNTDKVIIVGRDITERRRAEQVLMEAEEKFRTIVEQSLVGVYLLQDGRFIHVNPKFAQIFGYDASEMMASLTMKDLIAERDAREVMGEIEARLLEREGTFHRSFRGKRRDGTSNNLELYGTVTLYGSRPSLLGTLLDVTERKTIEEERARLFSAVEQSAESIVITDAAGTISYVNPSFERVTGYPKEEAIGQNSRILKSGEQTDEFYRELWSTLLRGEVWAGLIVNRKKDGSTYQEEMTISPVRDTSGMIVNYVAVKKDITRERLIEEQLRQAQKMESLRQMARGMAHDFNNIINVVLGTITLMRSRGGTDPTMEKYMTMGEGAVKRGIDIAKRLVMFSREEETQRAPLAISVVLRDLTESLKSAIEENIRIETDVPPDLPMMEAHQDNLFQSLLTLCLNARDAILAAHTAEGKIAIAASVVDGRSIHAKFPEATARQYIRITVSDNGTGMAEEMRVRIFEPFVTTEKPEGHGLGLAMVYGVVRNHDGFLDVQSTIGGGTTFSLFLPAMHVEQEEPRPPAFSTVPGGKETILVVEDEEALLYLLQEVLTSKGYKVLTASDGMKGLEIYKEHLADIDLVVTDMGLPKQSGHDLFLAIRQANPPAKVMLASGYLSPALKSKLFVAGAKAFIAKPFQMSDVLRKVREVLDLPT